VGSLSLAFPCQLPIAGGAGARPDHPISAVEFRLLESLAVRPGTTKSRDALRDILCEDQVMLHARAADSHIKRLRKKFRSVDKEFNEIESVYGIGYRFSDTRRNQ